MCNIRVHVNVERKFNIQITFISLFGTPEWIKKNVNISNTERLANKLLKSFSFYGGFNSQFSNEKKAVSKIKSRMYYIKWKQEK